MSLLIIQIYKNKLVQDILKNIINQIMEHS